MSGCVILIFAKAPVPGYAKTRLARTLGNDLAASLALRMLEHTVEAAVQADIGPVQLCCAPDTAHPAFEEASRKWGVSLETQGEGDLGARMQRAFCRALRRHQRVIIIGTDAPALGADSLRKAAEALQTKTAVFAPASDGGYALVGLTERAPELFENMTWSTGSVMATTHERLARIGMAWSELPVVHDVDEPEDLIHLPEGWLK